MSVLSRPRRAAAVEALQLATAAVAAVDLWVAAVHDDQNTRFQNTDHKLGVSNVANLTVKWVFTTGGDVSATPAVDGATVYVVDWAGNLFALDRDSGAQVW